MIDPAMEELLHGVIDLAADSRHRRPADAGVVAYAPDQLVDLPGARPSSRPGRSPRAAPCRPVGAGKAATGRTTPPASSGSPDPLPRQECRESRGGSLLGGNNWLSHGDPPTSTTTKTPREVTPRYGTHPRGAPTSLDRGHSRDQRSRKRNVHAPMPTLADPHRSAFAHTASYLSERLPQLEIKLRDRLLIDPIAHSLPSFPLGQRRVGDK